MRHLAIAACAVALASCATSKSSLSDKVSDADLGRLSATQTQPIHQAQQDVFRAQEDLNRAKLALEEAQHEKDLANADEAAADADLKRAEAEKKIADDSHDPNAINKASEMTETAHLHKRAADAHRDFANKLIAFREDEVKAGQQEIKLADAKVEVAKLRALQQANVPAATKYDSAVMQKNVNDAQTVYNEAQRKVTSDQAQAQAAEAMWHNLSQQYQARAQASPQRG